MTILFNLNLKSVFRNCKMEKTEFVEIEIDKLTNSIENAHSGDVFDTEVIKLLETDSNQITKLNWKFNWKDQLKIKEREVYKLVIEGNSKIIQGLISFSYQNDHIYIHLIESANFNLGKNKTYLGVAGNLFAFACKRSFEMGLDGYVAFDAKTVLIKHYEQTLAATHFKGTKMFIETPAAKKLIDQYFKK